MLSEKWRSMIIDSGTPSVMMAPLNQAGPSAVSRRSRVFPPARRESQAPRAPMNGSASIHSGASTIDTPFRVKNTQGGDCGTRSATNCTATEMRRVDRTGAHNCRTRMLMASCFSQTGNLPQVQQRLAVEGERAQHRPIPARLAPARRGTTETRSRVRRRSSSMVPSSSMYYDAPICWRERHDAWSDQQSGHLFSYLSPEQQVPVVQSATDHPRHERRRAAPSVAAVRRDPQAERSTPVWSRSVY